MYTNHTVTSTKTSNRLSRMPSVRSIMGQRVLSAYAAFDVTAKDGSIFKSVREILSSMRVLLRKQSILGQFRAAFSQLKRCGKWSEFGVFASLVVLTACRVGAAVQLSIGRQFFCRLSIVVHANVHGCEIHSIS
jgi:hypothetical protein